MSRLKTVCHIPRIHQRDKHHPVLLNVVTSPIVNAVSKVTDGGAEAFDYAICGTACCNRYSSKSNGSRARGGVYSGVLIGPPRVTLPDRWAHTHVSKGKRREITDVEGHS